MTLEMGLDGVGRELLSQDGRGDASWYNGVGKAGIDAHNRNNNNNH